MINIRVCGMESRGSALFVLSTEQFTYTIWNEQWDKLYYNMAAVQTFWRGLYFSIIHIHTTYKTLSIGGHLEKYVNKWHTMSITDLCVNWCCSFGKPSGSERTQCTRNTLYSIRNVYRWSWESLVQPFNRKNFVLLWNMLYVQTFWNDLVFYPHEQFRVNFQPKGVESRVPFCPRFVMGATQRVTSWLISVIFTAYASHYTCFCFEIRENFLNI